MDYEKKYKERLADAAYWHDNSEGDVCNVLEKIFPELQGSEDEKIKRCIKYAIDKIFLKEKYVCDVTKEAVCTWFKKQDEYTKDARRKYIEELLIADDIRQMAMNDEMIEEAKTKALDALSNLGIGKLLGLEKQCQSTKNGDENIVESKFHEGDWITNGEYIWKVTSVSYFDYTLENQRGDYAEDTIDYVDEEFHAWTIQDAKKGEILARGNEIILFHSRCAIDSMNAYCCLDDGEFVDLHIGIFDVEGFHPATKEERDKLMKSISNAGYKFDGKTNLFEMINRKH